ncbi:MAG: ABC transporter permease [Desulfovibrio sp.]|jgi:capsular polysaccharide transport system permease protein|nr:ABC transporter permease [Desulfovibrio sp.]
MKRTFTDALRLQGRVIWALALREIRGKHGKYRIGYLWELIKTGFGISVFVMIRTWIAPPTFHSLPLPLFLLLGFVMWFIFSGIVSMTMEAVITNKSLLTFPQITALDLYFSSAMVTWVTEIVVMALYAGILLAFDYSFQLYAPLTMAAALGGVFAFSFGIGLVLGAIAIYVPATEKVVPMVMRVLFFTSGVFFSPQQLAGRFSSAIMWNPLTNYIETLRSAFQHISVNPIIKTEYVAWVSLSVLSLGLLLERYVRGKQETI